MDRGARFSTRSAIELAVYLFLYRLSIVEQKDSFAIERHLRSLYALPVIVAIFSSFCLFVDHTDHTFELCFS
jgi:hypothetical protein